MSHPSNPRVCLWLQRNGLQGKTISFAERSKLIGKLSEETWPRQIGVGLNGVERVTKHREPLKTAPRASRSFLAQSKARDSSVCDKQQRTDEVGQGHTAMQGRRKVDALHQGKYTHRCTQRMPTHKTQPLLRRELGNLPRVPRNNGSVFIKNNCTSLRKYSLTNDFAWRRRPECRPKSEGAGNATANMRDSCDSMLKVDNGRGDKFGKDISNASPVEEASKARKVQLPTGFNLTLLSRDSVLNEPRTSHHDQLSLPTLNPDYVPSDSTSSNGQSAFYFEDKVDSLQSYSFECASHASPAKGLTKSTMYASKSNIMSWLRDVQQQRAETLLSIDT